MANKKKKNHWKTAFIILGIFVLITIIWGSSVEDTPSRNANTQIREITISGVGQEEIIYRDSPVKIILSGTDNVITVPKEVEVTEVILSGVDNTVVLCRGIHMPAIQKSGVGLEVLYKDC